MAKFSNPNQAILSAKVCAKSTGCPKNIQGLRNFFNQPKEVGFDRFC